MTIFTNENTGLPAALANVDFYFVTKRNDEMYIVAKTGETNIPIYKGDDAVEVFEKTFTADACDMRKYLKKNPAKKVDVKSEAQTVKVQNHENVTGEPELHQEVKEDRPKRHRRTKAEMEAYRASLAAEGPQK